MSLKSVSYYLVFLLVCILGILACKTYYFRANYNDANKLMHDVKNMHIKPYLKAHLKNGEVCVLNDVWHVDSLQQYINGKGTRFNFNRRQTFHGELHIPIDSVAIFETNNKIIKPEAGRVTALSILAGVDAAIGLICITNPKACFGSCPTFYLNEKDNFHYADAEGFSNAISPSMEYADIDALNNPTISDSVFSLTMKNEALETHCVKAVKILAYPRQKGQRIYQSPHNEFYACENNYQLSHALGKEGNMTSLLQKEDRQERYSLADGNNLCSKEEIYLTFDAVSNSEDLGLILNFRQTLMTTYFIYSAMGYMGDEVGDFFAAIETAKNKQNKPGYGIKNALGNIEVYAWNEEHKQWEWQNSVYETGPIAINRQIIPLKKISASKEVKLKLVMNKGLWRLDYLGLTNIKKKVTPVSIDPNLILNKGIVDPGARLALQQADKHLLSMPGSAYEFKFLLPANNTDYELFLFTKGYYLEWMREHWIKDKDLLKLRQLVYHPKRYLKAQAKDYKRYEKTMEQEFWNSKIDTKTFSYHEN